jgi:cation diffusion facilitator family transporter
MNPQRSEYIKRASYIAIGGNAVLAVLKIVIGLAGGSLAVVGDGIDTATDIITSFITFLAAVLMTKPPDKEHPYGHRRIEVLATKLLSFVIFFAGAQLAMSTVRSLFNAERADLPEPIVVYVTIVSILGKIFLAATLFRLGKTAESPMIIANGKNMLNDIIISSAVLVGLLFTFAFELPIIDTVLALLVSLWVMKTAVEVFLDSSVEVMESVRDHSVYDEIFAAVTAVGGAANPHRTRIRQISNLYVVDMDIEVDPLITVEEGHRIAMEVESTIKERVPNIYDIMVHVEPEGNEEREEKYGRSEAEG